MARKTATVEVNEQGRCTIPVEVRKALGFNGEEALVDLEIEYENDELRRTTEEVNDE